jgi:hypothetical protein
VSGNLSLPRFRAIQLSMKMPGIHIRVSEPTFSPDRMAMSSVASALRLDLQAVLHHTLETGHHRELSVVRRVGTIAA